VKDKSFYGQVNLRERQDRSFSQTAAYREKGKEVERKERILTAIKTSFWPADPPGRQEECVLLAPLLYHQGGTRSRPASWNLEGCFRREGHFLLSSLKTSVERRKSTKSEGGNGKRSFLTRNRACLAAYRG